MITNGKIKNIVNILEEYVKNETRHQYYKIFDCLKTLNDEEWALLWDEATENTNERIRVILYMECILNNPTNDKYENILKLLNETKAYTWDEKYFLRWQIVGQLFGKSDLGTRETTKLNCSLYQTIYSEYAKNFDGIKKIKDRNENLVFVTVQQFLNLNHGPTKTTIDRAYVLQKILGKQVIIVNTAEQYGGKMVNLSVSLAGNYTTDIREQLVYQDAAFPYVQFDDNMPNIENSKEFVVFVQKYKPAYIVNIGGNSLLLDLCSEIVPVLNINTVPSGLACTNATVQVLGRKLKESDNTFLGYLDKTGENVIEGRFTSMLKPQKYTYTREQLDIPEDAFIMTVIGGRLTEEVTEEFIKTLHPAFEAGALLFIIGSMHTYEELCRKDRLFGDHAIYLGQQEDVVALMELCDLYVNPKRTGGGTSVVEAMYKGCPAVTLMNGDVALGAGPEFCVNTYEEMSEMILKYMQDKEFYQKMSKKALERAMYDMDSNSAFSEIIHTFESKIQNW